MNELPNNHTDGAPINPTSVRTGLKIYPSPFFIHPLWLIPIALIAGLLSAGPIAASLLFRFQKKITALSVGIFSVICGGGSLYLLNWYPISLFWSGLIYTLINLFAGITLSFLSMNALRKFKISHSVKKRLKGNYLHVINGLLGGAIMGALFALPFTLLYLLFTDRLFSSLMPTIFDDFYSVMKLLIIVLFFTLSAAISGAFTGRLHYRIPARQVFSRIFILGLSFFSAIFCIELFIVLPGFQAASAMRTVTFQTYLLLFTILFITNLWLPSLELHYITLSPKLKERMMKAVLVIGINATTALTLATLFGYTADIYLSLGQYYEKMANISKARTFYEKGALKKPNPKTLAYLQYRLALVQHKLGNRETAIKGFKKVVAQFTANPVLIKKSDRFLENLALNKKGKRHVLPGIETRTEYKGGYCVPNSLALVMQYWGQKVTARQIGEKITGMGSGTFVVNQKWYAAQSNLAHDFLPLGTLDDIKQMLDSGFPVMVFVPAHVFVILGYDEALKTFVTYDVATEEVWIEYFQKDFIKSWKKEATTIVLVYPPDKKTDIPDTIKKRLSQFSHAYLHYQLYFFESEFKLNAIPHLLKAAGKNGDFFTPVTIMQHYFPGLRASLTEKFPVEGVADTIKKYYWDDFDEGIHLAGQHHNNRFANPDRYFKLAISYLISHGRVDLVKSIIERINKNGIISEDMRTQLGLLYLFEGKYEKGLIKLDQSYTSESYFYASLARLDMGEKQMAIRDMIQTLPNLKSNISFNPYHSDTNGGAMYRSVGFFDRKERFYLDDYGFPHTAFANQLLGEITDLGEHQGLLKEKWERWLNHLPFDAQVASRLFGIYESELSQIEEEKAPRQVERLRRKKSLTESRMSRYGLSTFYTIK